MRSVLFIIIGIILILVIFNFLGLLSFNNMIPQSPDTSCIEDRDCVLLIYPEEGVCSGCGASRNYFVNESGVIAVNKDWKPYCPFPEPFPVCLAVHYGVVEVVNKSGRSYATHLTSHIRYVRCIDNVCHKVLNS